MRRSVFAFALAVAFVAPVFAAALPVSAAGAADPTSPGPFGVVRSEYDLGATGLAGGGAGTSPVDATFIVRLNGSVHYPESGAGPFPLLLLMHGRHTTCVENGGSETLGNELCLDFPHVAGLPVPHPTDPIDSYRGYDYLAQNLASHGYVVVSVNANGVNDNDNSVGGDYGATARAQLALRTIDRFLLIGASPVPVPVPLSLVGLVGRIDESRIGLMGHSRGGEGVARAVTLNQAGFDGSVRAIKGVFALAPTDFQRWSAPNVPLGTLLPYCDGDVSNLQGAWLYDDNRLASESVSSSTTAFLVMGANHNWYNTVWWFDDVRYSFPSDAYCGTSGSGRFSASDQQRHGLGIMGAFLRYHVGGESQFGPFVKGDAPPGAGTCPAAQPACASRIRVSHMEGAAARRVVEDAASSAALSSNDLGGATTLAGFAGASVCVPSSCPGNEVARAPQLLLRWSAAGARYATALPAGQRDVTGFGVLSMRAAIAAGDSLNPSGAAQDYRIVLADGAGVSASVRASEVSFALQWPPASGFAQKNVLADVRVPLSAFAGVDLSNVARVELVFDVTPRGAVTVNDLAFQ